MCIKGKAHFDKKISCKKNFLSVKSKMKVISIILLICVCISLANVEAKCVTTETSSPGLKCCKCPKCECPNECNCSGTTTTTTPIPPSCTAEDIKNCPLCPVCLFVCPTPPPCFCPAQTTESE